MTALERTENQAFQLLNLGEYEEAAALFFKAAHIENSLAKKRSEFSSPNRSFVFELQAAFCLFKDGQFEKAAPIFKKAIDYDWKANRQWLSRTYTEDAITYLLLNSAEKQDTKEFKELFDIGIEKGAYFKLPFPHRCPNQKTLITACLALGDTKKCQIILNNLNEEWLKEDKELKLLQSVALNFINSNTITPVTASSPTKAQSNGPTKKKKTNNLNTRASLFLSLIIISLSVFLEFVHSTTGIKFLPVALVFMTFFISRNKMSSLSKSFVLAFLMMLQSFLFIYFHKANITEAIIKSHYIFICIGLIIAFAIFSIRIIKVQDDRKVNKHMAILLFPIYLIALHTIPFYSQGIPHNNYYKSPGEEYDVLRYPHR